MRKKIITIGFGVFLFLGAFVFTNYVSAGDCKTECPATDANGCKMTACRYKTTYKLDNNGNIISIQTTLICEYASCTPAPVDDPEA